MKAVFLDFGTMGAGELDPSPLSGLLPDLEIFDSTRGDQVAERIAGAEFVFVNKVRLTADLIAGNPELRFIGLTATGVDNVDIDAAKKGGVAVCNIRSYCTQSVVEHVFGVLLNLTHSIRKYDRSARSGAWERADNFCLLGFPIRELSAMTLGIVGYGNLGKAVAAMGRQFGMHVMIARRIGEQPAEADGRFDLGEVLAKADVVSLHCPLTEATRRLISDEEFATMKPGAILVNTARGGLVDSYALVDALKNGTIAAAAIDVLPEEPPVTGDPLLDYPGDNLIVTPHIAWGTVEARQSALDEVAANARAFIEGGKRNRVV